MTDLIPVIDALGGGLSAVVIVALLVALGALYRQNQALHERRMDDFRESAQREAERDRENTAALNAMASALREHTLQNAMRGRGDV
jgi:hypothetical protein